MFLEDLGIHILVMLITKTTFRTVFLDPETGEEVEQGRQGEIVVRARLATRHYLGNHQVCTFYEQNFT